MIRARVRIGLCPGDAGDLISRSVVEEGADLGWRGDVIITPIRDYVRASQSVTLRWKITNEHA